MLLLLSSKVTSKKNMSTSRKNCKRIKVSYEEYGIQPMDIDTDEVIFEKSDEWKNVNSIPTNFYDDKFKYDFA